MAHRSKNREALQIMTSPCMRLKSFPALLLLLLIFPLARAQTSSGTISAQPGRIAPSIPGKDADLRALEPGVPFEREIKPGETHSYQLRCDAGQFAQVTIEQLGSNVAVSLFGADGEPVLSLNNIDDVEGSERVPVLTGVAGNYRLDVRALGRVEAGRYRMEVSIPRAATQEDRDYLSAELLLQTARQFVGRGTGQSKRAAISKYMEALPLLRASGNREREATVLNNIGFFYRTLGELKNALEYFNQALALRRALGDRRGEAISLDNLGYVYVSSGEIQKGIDLYNQALSLERADKNLRGEANTLSNIGAVYADLGETERALDFYNRSLPLYRAAGGRPREALALTRMGSIYFSRGENERALEFYERALAIQQTLKIRSGVADTRQQIGLLYAKLGDNQKAFDYLNQALEFGRKTGNGYVEATTLTLLGEVSYDRGERGKALDYFNQALPLRRASGDLQGEALTLYWLARSERDRGRLAEARANIESALDIIENMRGRIISQELRVSYFSTAQKYYDFYIDLLFELSEKDVTAGYSETALQASERARARGLLDLLAEAHADIRRGVEPALLEQERALRQQLNARAEEQLRLLSGEHTDEQAKTLTTELNLLIEGYNDVQTRIRKTSPHYAALTQPQTLSLKEIQPFLDKETLLLEYKLGERRSFVWAATPTTINMYELPGRVEVEMIARRLYQLLTARNEHPQGETLPQRRVRLAQAEEDYAKTAARLTHMLLAPVASHLKTKRLFIISDGALQYVPFAALPEPDVYEAGIKSEKANAGALQEILSPLSGTAKPLIADHEIISLPSASVIAVLRRELLGRRAAPKMIAVLADPVFDKADARVKQRASGQPRINPANAASVGGNIKGAPTAALTTETAAGGVWPTPKGELSLPRLVFSRLEAERILSSAPAGDGLGAFNFQASRAVAISPRLAEYRVLHFATHGVLDSERPELSAIVLSLVDEQGQPQNGFVRLNEIYNLNLPADLVMLSACQTGLGKEIKGEGLVGLTRGFMYAGAARVGTSLWKVDDAATAALMERFYIAMFKEGKSAPAALRTAQLEMLKQRRWQSPYYWAAFILQGEWK